MRKNEAQRFFVTFSDNRPFATFVAESAIPFDFVAPRVANSGKVRMFEIWGYSPHPNLEKGDKEQGGGEIEEKEKDKG